MPQDTAGTIIADLNPVPVIAGLSCAQIALIAATGKSRSDVDAALAKAAKLEGLPINWKQINTRIWRRALCLLGFVPDRDDCPEPQRNVDQFMAGNDHADLILVVVQHRNRPDDDHVFAAQRNRVVDFYTEGRIEKYDSSKNELRHSLVIHIVHVRRRPPNEEVR
jgi:hypothetical protein